MSDPDAWVRGMPFPAPLLSATGGISVVDLAADSVGITGRLDAATVGADVIDANEGDFSAVSASTVSCYAITAPTGILAISANSLTIGAAGDRLGFNGSGPVLRPAITGPKAGNTALALSVLSALVALGLVTDATT
jgi:hypothetical protein